MINILIGEKFIVSLHDAHVPRKGDFLALPLPAVRPDLYIVTKVVHIIRTEPSEGGNPDHYTADIHVYIEEVNP